MNKTLIIFGTGSLARIAYYYASHEMNFKVEAFVVDSHYKISEKFLDRPVFTWDEAKKKFPSKSTSMFVAVGYRSIRARSNLYRRAKSEDYDLVNIFSKAAQLAMNISLGDNNIFFPGVVLEPNVLIGSNNIFWSNTTICHNTKLANHNFFASNVTIGGEVEIGSQNFFGFSSVVLQNLKIPSEVLIGAQSLVMNDLDGLAQYHGSPALKIKAISDDDGICID
jgi:sugar O-acyltransferase (sialic acid O-acetyltransferase NeuD family)